MRDAILTRLHHLQAQPPVLLALAGPPGSGKSTLAAELGAALGHRAQVVPMDGFHLDNAVLDADGLRHLKGAPQTIDADGFYSLVHRVKSGDATTFPLFDRDRDCTLPGAGHIKNGTEVFVFEGNYLLYDAPVWRDLAPLWDLSVFLDIPEAELDRRLIARWRSHGHAPAEAEARARGNDLANARLVQTHRLPADLVLTQQKKGCPKAPQVR